MKAIPLLLLLVAGLVQAQAQDISTESLRWTCHQTTDLRSNTTTAYSCEFKTQGTSSVSWLQRNGEVTTSYTVTGSEGTWTNVAGNGTITYLLSRDGKSGRLTVERTSEGCTITLDFSSNGDMAIKRKFSVSAIQPAN